MTSGRVLRFEVPSPEALARLATENLPGEMRASAARLFEMMESGAVEVRVGARFPLHQAADAHRALEARATTGSTVLLP